MQMRLSLLATGFLFALEALCNGDPKPDYIPARAQVLPITPRALPPRRSDVPAKGVDAVREGKALQPQNHSTTSIWDTETNAACIAALDRLPRSTNPSGNCICYNLPSLDLTTGVFQADMRLYRISDPRDGFAGVSPSDVSVMAQFHGARVSQVTPEQLVVAHGDINRTRSLLPRSDSKGPQLLRTYHFIGEINPDRMAKVNKSMAAIEAILLPVVTLKAQKAHGGAVVSTNVSLNEASFLTGVYSNRTIVADFAAAQAAVDLKMAELQNGTIAFVMPGVQLMVYPVGFIITSAWLLLGSLACDIGTYERLRHAKSYKRRLAAATTTSRHGEKGF